MFKYYFPDHIVVLIIRKRLLLQGVEFETDDFLPKKKNISPGKLYSCKFVCKRYKNKTIVILLFFFLI